MSFINESIKEVEGFAPATCANVAVGFDILGFSFSALGDRVKLSRRQDKKIVIEAIEGEESLPFKPAKNTASVALQAFSKAMQFPFGFSIQIKKGIPLCSGMGGSAASAVAALVAANQFLQKPLALEAILPFALLGEKVASGSFHADNVAPALMGGLTLIQNHNPCRVLQLPVPNLYCVFLHPHLKIATRSARKILAKNVGLKVYVQQSTFLATFIAALFKKDLRLLAQSLQDVLIEPQRARLIPHFYTIKEAALAAGAINLSVSGSGPTLFSFSENKEIAQNIAYKAGSFLKEKGIAHSFWIAKLNARGAYHALCFD